MVNDIGPSSLELNSPFEFRHSSFPPTQTSLQRIRRLRLARRRFQLDPELALRRKRLGHLVMGVPLAFAFLFGLGLDRALAAVDADPGADGLGLAFAFGLDDEDRF